MAVRIRANRAEINRYIDRQGGPYIAEVSAAVLRVARFQAPRRSGALVSSGRVRGPRTRGSRVAATVVFTAKHAIYVQRGTGLYGPRRSVIRPTRKRFLRWEDNGIVHFAKSVRGMRPIPFLTDALRQVCEPLGFTIRKLGR